MNKRDKDTERERERDKERGERLHIEKSVEHIGLK